MAELGTYLDRMEDDDEAGVRSDAPSMPATAMEYVSLHAHTTFSFMDGFGLPREHANRVAELGGRALAQTEHGNVTGHVKHEQACVAAGIKPIFGCEVYTAPGDMREKKNLRKWHLTVLAENAGGYRNLLRLVSRSWDEGFYRWPTVLGPMLTEQSEGLIVLSGCSDSHLNCVLLGGKGIPTPSVPRYAEARKVALGYRELLGDGYFLEVQQFPELDRTREINTIMERLSADTGIPLVASADVHYPHPDDNEIQKILHAAGRNTGTVAAAEAGWEYNIRLTHPLSDDYILERLEATGLSGKAAEEAVRNTGIITDRCNVTLPKADWLRYPLPPAYGSAKELVWAWLRQGWHYRAKSHPEMVVRQKEYVAKLKYEMGLIEGKDFLDYFLMLSDVVRFAKDNGIPVGPGRGSAAASLACYLLRITEVDPMQFPNMIFERFIDVNRTDLPDIDLDFDDELRYKIREHLVDMYGAERVGNLGNYTRYRGKNSVVDVCRVYGIPKFAENIVKGLVIERSGGDSRFDASLEDTFEMFPQAHEQLEKYPDLANAIRLEGNYKALGVHAAGLVVCNSPINDFAATYSRVVKGHKVEVVSVDKYDAEHLNLLKADFLGLTTMGMIRYALEMIDMPLADLYNIPLDEPATLAAFKAGDVVGIFQFEGRATRLVNNDVSPDNFGHLSDINALARPGPLFSGATAAYVETRHGKTKPERFHPAVDAVTGDTYGQIVYQEQILRIVREVGGFSYGDMGAIRKIISQKKGEAAFNRMQEQFVTGSARLHGIDRDLALRIWRKLVTSGTYSFNIAHCVSYSLIGFWCMWLKVHHPVAFYSAQLRKAGKDRWGRLLKDAAKHDIEVLPPDLRRSARTWAPDWKAGAVRAGFTQVPGIGEKTADAILEARETEPFKEWKDLIRVKGIGPKTMLMIREFAESEDPFRLEETARVLNEVRTALKQRMLGAIPNQTHTSDDMPPDMDNTRVVFVGLPRQKNYQDYIENQRARTGEEVEEIIARMDNKDKVTSCVVHCYDEGDEDVYLRFERRHSFPAHEHMLESLRLDGNDVLVIAGLKRSGFGVAIQVQKMWILAVDDDDPDDVQDLDESEQDDE